MHSQALANFFIEKSIEDFVEVNHSKLQYLMYIAAGWCLALLDKDVTEGEGFLAWQAGPVLPSVYHEFKRFARLQIATLATEYDSESNKVIFPKLTDSDTLNVLSKVWGIYQTFSDKSLATLIKKSDSPWFQAYLPENKHSKISVDLMKSYFASDIENLLEDELQLKV